MCVNPAKSVITALRVGVMGARTGYIGRQGVPRGAYRGAYNQGTRGAY